MILSKLKIIPFSPSYSTEFRDLNTEWLEKYFYLEPYDKVVLGNPQTYIIDKGGYIFFAKLNEQIVGTFALMKQKECFELSKMAVSPKFQGYKIGQKLLDTCIAFSKEQGWKKIMLYSNTKLESAIYLYRKYGFEEVPLEADVNYQRADIKMMLKL